MAKQAFRALIVTALLGPSFASAQVRAELRVDLPVVLPPMVVISPGVQVVQDVNEEVFFHDGYYWVRRDGRWWRSRTHRGGWAMVEPRRVPPGLSRIPPGQYKHWHKAEKQQMKAEKRERKEQRKFEKHEKHEKHEGHGHGHGRGHGD
jgi:hypothetical protein